MTESALGEQVRLRPLTLVDEGDDVLVGDAEAGTFVAVPQVGAVVIRALQGGATLAEAGAQAERFADTPIDVAEFVDTLRELGFLADDAATAPVRTAPIQNQRWLEGPAPHRVRPLFSTPAWCFYAATFLGCAVVFVLRPDLWPWADDALFLDQAGVALLVLFPITLVLSGMHECWHWLAGRAAGVGARFGLDRRAYFVVFETDLSQVWTLPRRQRYGPQLAGLACDSVVLATLLVIQLAHQTALVAALVFAKVVTMLWQCMVFLRTDLYAVLVTATGCRNLWEVKTLLLRRALGRSRAGDAEALDAADPRDLRVGRWFRWVYLGGMLVAAGYAALFVAPVIVSALDWTVDGLSEGPASGTFWLALGSALPIYLPPLVALSLYVWERVGARRRTAVP